MITWNAFLNNFCHNVISAKCEACNFKLISTFMNIIDHTKLVTQHFLEIITLEMHDKNRCLDLCIYV